MIQSPVIFGFQGIKIFSQNYKKGDMRGSYCIYSWKDDGSDTRLESKHEFKADAFAAADKWNEENKGSGRTAGIGWIRSDGQIDGYIGA